MKRRALPFAVPCALAATLIGCGREKVASNQDHPTFEQWAATVYHEKQPGGVWIVNGDTPMASRQRLRMYYFELFSSGGLIVHQSGGVDARWNDTQKRNLTYCVSDSFETFGVGIKAQVVQAMLDGAAMWEAAADVKFIHDATQDATCDAANTNVVFDVSPVAEEFYIARAFFPDQERATRNVIINIAQMNEFPLGNVLGHELGHALGFRHEHARPEEGGLCFEDFSWRPLTPYDQASIMHYPQCGDQTNPVPILTFSALDAIGARELYGPPPGPDCGNAECAGDETCGNCPQDCGVCPSVCGNLACESGEDCESCSEDCGVCPPVCGNASCEESEHCFICPEDCGACPVVCGDTYCDPGEDCESCAMDCGECPVSGCGNGQCDPGEDCDGCPSDCGGCGPICGDGKCSIYEGCQACPQDCGECPGCNNGVCEPGETYESCPADCGSCQPACGNGTCEAGETCASCEDDCGRCQEPEGDCGCAHPLCASGDPLDPSCHSCAADICAVDPYCCAEAWDPICVALVTQVCGLACEGETPRLRVNAVSNGKSTQCAQPEDGREAGLRRACAVGSF